MSFIFFIRWSFFFDLGVDMVVLVVYNSVCQQGFGRLCWWTPFFGSGDMVGIPAGYDCPPAWSYLVGIFYLTLFRGFVIMLCEGNQILSLCMLRFNPFPRGLSWCSSLLFGVTLQRYSVGWWWGIFFFVLGWHGFRVCVIIWVQAKNTSCWVLLGFFYR